MSLFATSTVPSAFRTIRFVACRSSRTKVMTAFCGSSHAASGRAETSTRTGMNQFADVKSIV
jgi:hypothetical protein